jgi:hypothetical protein
LGAKPISKVLDKVIPNEIKPALPFAAAAFPFLAPELMATMQGGLGSLGISNPILQRAIIGGGLNLGSQASQEGAEKRGINPMSLGLATLGGGLTASPSAFTDLMSSGTPYSTLGVGGMDYTGLGNGYSNINNALGNYSNLPGVGNYGLEINALPEVNNLGTNYSTLDKIQNATLSGGKTASEFFNKGVEGFQGTGPDNGILNKDFLKAYAPGAVGAASDLAYNTAKDKALEFEKQQTGLGQTATANRQNQIDYIRTAMKKAEFTDAEIDDALKRSGFASGGRAGYGLGGDVLKALGDVSKNIKYGGGFKKGIARTYENVKKPILDRIAKFGDDIDIRISNYDYADDAGESYDIIVKPKNKKGETIMNKLAEENPFDRKNFDEGIRKEGNEYTLPQGQFATHYLDDALSRGARASGVTTDTGDFYRTKDLWQTSSDPYGYTLHNPEQDVYEALSKYQKKADGGLMSLGGHEMDYRAAGGFVPIGQKERADDVPARLSKNEFVFTAKAVRNAGGGDIKEGAKRMYQIMKQLEAKA